MGFIYQVPPMVAGTVLIIEREESQNYVPGVSGWAIFADGDAEFNSVIARGTIIVGPDPGNHIEISNDNLPDHEPRISFYTGSPSEGQEGRISSSGPSGGTGLSLFLEAPTQAGHLGNATINIENFDPAVDPFESFIGLQANEILAQSPIILDLGWTVLTGLLAGTWVDVAGGRVGFIKDAAGVVHWRGQAVGGAGTTIYTIPGPAAGQPGSYRPTQTMEWVMRAVGGVTMCAISITPAGVVSVTANAAAAQATGIKLDAISYPTLF